MTRPTLRLAAAALLVLPILARGEAMAPDPAAAFTDMIAASRMVMTVRNGRADGPGARYLAEKATQSSFFLIGEEHGVATIADTIRALVPILHEAGYRRLAVEADPYTARVVEDRLREGGPDALAKYLHQDGYAIAMPFFGWASEAALADAFLAGTSSGPQGTLWGLDQVFIGAYGPLLERIGKQASSPAARELATALAAQARGNMDFLAKVEQSQFDTLRAQLALAGDTELVSMVDEMILSSRIYAPFIGRAGWSVYVANDTRENLMKQNFLSRYRAANQSKVLFKFGSNHMVRGLSPTHVAVAWQLRRGLCPVAGHGGVQPAGALRAWHAGRRLPGQPRDLRHRRDPGDAGGRSRTGPRTADAIRSGPLEKRSAALEASA